MQSISDLRESLYKTISKLEDINDIPNILPVPEQNNFYEIISGLRTKLVKELNDYAEFLREEENDETLQLYNKYKKMIEIIDCYVFENTKDYNESLNDNLEESSLPKRHLIFGKNEFGRVPFLDDVKKDIPKEYYEVLDQMIQSLIYDDVFSMNEVKFKKLSENSKLKMLYERKEFKIRISLIPITRDVFYIERVLLKKSDNDIKYQKNLNSRKKALSLDHFNMYKRVKSKKGLEQLWEEEEINLNEIYKILNKKLNKVGDRIGKSK